MIRNDGIIYQPADGPCADQSLAQTVYQGFAGTFLAHVLNFHWAFVDYNSRQSAGPAFWTFQGPVFKAWPTQQTSTVPLFRMTTPTNSDFVFMVGTNAQTPPTKSGFATSTGDIVAWVYNTAVCGSVPLMSAVLAAQSDHYYTADPNEHTALLTAGWADSGVVAYVLPLSTS